MGLGLGRLGVSKEYYSVGSMDCCLPTYLHQVVLHVAVPYPASTHRS